MSLLLKKRRASSVDHFTITTFFKECTVFNMLTAGDFWPTIPVCMLFFFVIKKRVIVCDILHNIEVLGMFEVLNFRTTN